MKEITLSVLKADVGSIGGHTKPSRKMMELARQCVAKAIESGLIVDGMVSYTGDDICFIVSHRQGKLDQDIHLKFAWDSFQRITQVAEQAGLYGAGQDLIVDVPTGNITGAGPAVAEITFDLEAEERPIESFMVFTSDKTGPGVYSFPLYAAFGDPMYCGGLILVPHIHQGFTFTVIDMEAKGDGDLVVELNLPEDLYKLLAFLRDENRYAIRSIHSRAFPNQECAAVSAERLKHIANAYVGKDDSVAIVRNQKILPAPEEIVSPWTRGHLTSGGARGSHVMPVMPVAINTPVTGTYCLPLVSALQFSMNSEGKFADEYVDAFGNPAWDQVRLDVQRRAMDIRNQGVFGPAMQHISELEYGGIRGILDSVKFELRKDEAKTQSEQLVSTN